MSDSDSDSCVAGSNATYQTTTKFQHEHKTILRALIPEYETYIEKHNPLHQRNNKALKDWREKTAKRLLQTDPVFMSLPNATIEFRQWEIAICRFFINYYNNTFLRRKKPHPSKSHFSSSSVPGDGSSKPSPSKAVDKVLRRAIVTFLGDLSAREMYASENEEDLKAAMHELQKDHPDLQGGGLRNKALKKLWATADQSLWEDRITQLVEDVDANQTEFPELINRALQNLCGRKALGSTLMSFSWAFRDKNDDHIKGGGIITGYDVHGEAVLSTVPMDYEKQIDAWLLHADAVIPRKSSALSNAITINEDGIPLIPHIDTLDAGPAKMSTLFHEYFTALWRAARGISIIPWTEIEKNPSSYYDTSIYRLPTLLQSPEHFKKSPGSAYILYEYLSSISDSMPFRFSPAPTVSSSTPNPVNTTPLAPIEPATPSDHVPVLSAAAPNQSSDMLAPPHSAPVLPSATPPQSLPTVSDTVHPNPVPTIPTPPITSSLTVSDNSQPTPPIIPALTVLDTPMVNTPGAAGKKKPQKRGRAKGNSAKANTASSAATDNSVGELLNNETRRSSRPKRKQSEVNTEDSTRAIKKTKTLGDRWFYPSLDENGDLLDQNGNKIDSRGNIIAAASTD